MINNYLFELTLMKMLFELVIMLTILWIQIPIVLHFHDNKLLYKIFLISSLLILIRITFNTFNLVISS